MNCSELLLSRKVLEPCALWRVVLLVNQSSVGSKVGDAYSCTLGKVQTVGQFVYTVVCYHGKLCITSSNCAGSEDTVSCLQNMCTMTLRHPYTKRVHVPHQAAATCLWVKVNIMGFINCSLNNYTKPLYYNSNSLLLLSGEYPECNRGTENKLFIHCSLCLTVSASMHTDLQCSDFFSDSFHHSRYVCTRCVRQRRFPDVCPCPDVCLHRVHTTGMDTNQHLQQRSVRWLTRVENIR